MEIRSAYSPRVIVAIDDFGPGQTKQNHKKECDINVIMAKYQKTGVITHIKNHGREYGDYDAITYEEAMQTVAEGNSLFEELPSKARAHFDNDPAKFMETVNSEDGINTLKKLGLAYGDPYEDQAPETPTTPPTPEEPPSE